jgi:hypothetical protein
MAVIRDIIPAFELYQPAGIDDAIRLLEKHGADALVLAGGLDSMDWLKDRLKRPKVVVDLGPIKELRGIREVNGGLEIGAMTPLTEIVKHPVVRDRFSLLMEAAELVASPQIRNQGTLGGNVSQDTRCWYYRGGWTCYRGRQHLLRGHADGRESRARDLRRRSLRGGQPVGYRAGPGRPRREDGHPRAEGRAGRRRRGLLDWAGDRHHQDEHSPAERAARLDQHSVDDGRGTLLFREGARSPGVGLPAG